MHLVEAVDGRMVHQAVDAHIQEIIGHHCKADGLDKLPMGGELIEGKTDPNSFDADIYVKREDNKLIDDDVLQGTPFHVVPVVLLPRSLQARLGLVLLIGLDSQVARQKNEAEDEDRCIDGDAGYEELEGLLVFDLFGPYGLGKDGSKIKIGNEENIPDCHIQNPIFPYLQFLNLPDSDKNILYRL